MKKWLNTELPKEVAGRFKEFCRDYGIKYSASECWNLIHFECLMDENERILADKFIDENC